jgi:glycosyltransferase involved in cell wall biosynthesis
MVTVRESTGSAPSRSALRVGVNAHLLSLSGNYRSAGINWYIHNLLRHLPQADPKVEYTVFLNEHRYTAAPGVRLQFSRLPTQRPPVRILWEQVFQPRAVRRADVDLAHGPAFVGALASRYPFVITVHDLSFLLYPQNFRTMNRLYLKTLTRLSVRRARRVIAVSESTKRDLVQQYDLSPARIDTVYNGVDPSFRPLPPDQVAAFRTKRGLPERFILFVGTLEPRKNLVRLVEAYSQLSRPRPPLMLVGGKGWLYEQIFARVEALDLCNDVHFVGYVSTDELPWWYNAAALFAYPSLYEGFGLPPLEAMACGTPVVTSTASSLPEVVGDAGWLVDPADTASLVEAMGQALTDENEREKMRAAGLVRAQGFSWQETARCTVNSYRKALMSEEDKEGV